MDLEKFAKKMFELSDWPDCGDIDGCDFHEAAVECGLLIGETRYDVLGKGVTCYRKAPFLMNNA